MFRQLATALVGAPGIPDEETAMNAVLTDFRPSQLSEFLEFMWTTQRNATRFGALGTLLEAGDHQAMGRPGILDPLSPAPADPPSAEPEVTWHHIVYAYMLENTRMVDIFRRVIAAWTHGEQLPTATDDTQRWIHTTEQLFFSRPPWYGVRSVTSDIRPDHGAVRRNAYYRMLGMDLNHGTEDGRPYPYIKSEAANRDFASAFEALLVEVWRGYVNRTTTVAENQTDDNAIVNLVRRLREMLRSRRGSGALSREEFDAVAMLSWFHLAIEKDTQVVLDLNARAGGIADRLKIIGERVSLPAHARSDAYLQLAAPMSIVLLAIESEAVANDASVLYAGTYMPDMLNIITHWSIATGRNVKDPALRQPLGAVLGTAGTRAPALPSGNGVPVSRIAVALR